MAGVPEVSHGRGGAGNIRPDDTEYVDGSIVREGPEGSHGDGAFSTGRGGGGNIVDAGKPPQPRADREVIPEQATRPSAEEDRHVGRGGAANVEPGLKHEQHEHHAAADPHHKVADGTPAPAHATTTPAQNMGLADKLKLKLKGIFKK